MCGLRETLISPRGTDLSTLSNPPTHPPPHLATTNLRISNYKLPLVTPLIKGIQHFSGEKVIELDHPISKITRFLIYVYTFLLLRRRLLECFMSVKINRYGEELQFKCLNYYSFLAIHTDPNFKITQISIRWL